MYRNNEHYADPTFAEAYANIRRQMKTAADSDWIYIASPYRGDVKRNTENAKKYAAFAVRQGKLPLCPCTAKKGGQPKAGFCAAKVLSIIYFTQFLNDAAEDERSIGLNLALQMLKRCKEIWVFGGYISLGMDRELRMAQRWNIPVRFFNVNCKEDTVR